MLTFAMKIMGYRDRRVHGLPIVRTLRRTCDTLTNPSAGMLGVNRVGKFCCVARS